MGMGKNVAQNDPAMRPVIQMAHLRGRETPREVGCYTSGRCTGPRSEEEHERWIV